MKKNKKIGKAIDFQKDLAKQLKNPKFRRYYNEYGEQLKIAYQILQMRKKKGISQKALAEKIGTKQSNVARLESGQQNLTIGLVSKIAEVLGYKFKPEFSAK